MPRSDELDYDFLEACGVPQPLVEQMEEVIENRNAGHRLMLDAVVRVLRADDPMMTWDTLSKVQRDQRSPQRILSQRERRARLRRSPDRSDL